MIGSYPVARRCCMLIRVDSSIDQPFAEPARWRGARGSCRGCANSRRSRGVVRSALCFRQALELDVRAHVDDVPYAQKAQQRGHFEFERRRGDVELRVETGAIVPADPVRDLRGNRPRHVANRQAELERGRFLEALTLVRLARDVRKFCDDEGKWFASNIQCMSRSRSSYPVSRSVTATSTDALHHSGPPLASSCRVSENGLASAFPEKSLFVEVAKNWISQRPCTESNVVSADAAAASRREITTRRALAHANAVTD